MFAREGNVLNSSTLRVCALLTTANVLCCAALSHAGMFDRLKSRPRRTAAVTTSRAQSPGYETSSGGGWQQTVPTVAATPWYSDSGQSVGYGAPVCCGPDDKYAWCREQCRRKCDQTFYCTSPPYCFPCYGHHTTCWRRMQECTLCPREMQATPPPKAPRAIQPAPPALPAAPPAAAEPPEPKDDPNASRARVGAGRIAQVSARPLTPSAAARSRWTGYADAAPPAGSQKDDSLDTLEEMIAAEDEARSAPLPEEVDAQADEADETAADALGETDEMEAAE